MGRAVAVRVLLVEPVGPQDEVLDEGVERRVDARPCTGRRHARNPQPVAGARRVAQLERRTEEAAKTHRSVARLFVLEQLDPIRARRDQSARARRARLPSSASRRCPAGTPRRTRARRSARDVGPTRCGATAPAAPRPSRTCRSPGLRWLRRSRDGHIAFHFVPQFALCHEYPSRSPAGVGTCRSKSSGGRSPVCSSISRSSAAATKRASSSLVASHDQPVVDPIGHGI